MNDHFKHLISECLDAYSAVSNQETHSFDVKWQPMLNSSFTPNSSYSPIYNSFQYTPSSHINSFPHVGNVETYSGGGYVFEMKDQNPNEMSSNLNLLRSLNWIDAQTVALFIEFTLFNPNLNLFQSCLILFEKIQIGSIVSTSQFSSIDLYDINNTQLISFKILISILFMLFVCIIMIVEIREIIQKKLKYFLDIYNYIELLIIAFAWSAFSMFLYRLYESNHIYKELNSNQFINLQYLTSCDTAMNYFLGFCVAFASLRFVKILRFNKRVIVFFLAFKNSLRELISFGFMFMIVWMSFAQVFYLLLNDHSLEFSSFAASMSTCFQIMLGKFNSNVFYATNGSMLRPVLFVAYNICIVFIMVNTLITILVENYQLARDSTELEEQDPDLYNYVKSLLVSMFSFSSLKKQQQGQMEKAPSDYLSFIEALPYKFEEYLERIEKVFFKLVYYLVFKRQSLKNWFA